MKQPFRVNEIAYWLVEDAEGTELCTVTTDRRQDDRKARAIAFAMNQLPVDVVEKLK